MLDDGEAQPGPAGGPRARGVDAVEALEDPQLVVRGDAVPLVGDDELDDVARDRAHGHGDPGVRLAVGDGVADEVGDRRDEQGMVAPDLAVRRWR